MFDESISRFEMNFDLSENFESIVSSNLTVSDLYMMISLKQSTNQ